MKKIQLFAAPDISILQSEINSWLSQNKDAHIIESNITSLQKTKQPLSSESTGGEYVFYILYTPANEGEEESVIAAAKQMPAELIDGTISITEVN
jgi:hypothetical protein